MNTTCKHYDECRLPAQTCNKKCIWSKVPGGWTITFNPKPIPDRCHDYDFIHENYDGADGGNGLSGTAESAIDAAQQIREIEKNLCETQFRND